MRIVFLVAVFFALASEMQATNYTVTNTNDSGAGSLREAINSANGAIGADNIYFNIPTSDLNYDAGTGTWTITLLSTLPMITTGYINIDATSQQTNQGNTNPAGYEIVLKKGSGTYDYPIMLVSPGNSVKGFIIQGFNYGIMIYNSTATGNTISQNYIGTNYSATAAASLPNQYGIAITNGASGNTISGNIISGNIISGNSGSGIVLNGTGTRNNYIKGNFIGADISGVLPLSNYAGITITSNANHNFIGGTGMAERNIISGNYEMGVYIESSDSNLLVNNFFGPDSTGLAAFKISNDTLLQSNGIEFNTVSKNNTLGGYTAAERNVISGNRVYGMVYYGNCSYNPVIGNYIGVDATGNNALPNATGICVDGGSNHNPILRNVLSGNYSYGIFIVTTGTYYNTFSGNIVGLNAAGTDTVPNDAGILIGGGTKYNLIGGSTVAERNIISGNRFGGIEIADIGTRFNTIRGNYIGTDISGLLARPNLYGLSIISECSQNTVDSNVISGNLHYGILLFENADSNIITRNYIGPGADSIAAIGNGTVGVVLWNGSSHNQIGGDGLGNAIAYHDSCGIAVKDNNTLYNTLSGNSLYENSLMGIDIFPEGPNANDAGDTDSGPNELMNYPVITHAAYNASNGMTWVYGILDTETPENVIVELFVAVPDSTVNHGEGQIYLGRTYCDAAGNWMFYGPGVSDGMLLTSTATSVYGSTSEFSENYTVIASIDESQAIQMALFPNPCADRIRIESYSGNIQHLEVFSTDGQRVYGLQDINSKSIDWVFGTALNPGLYIAKISDQNGGSQTIQFSVTAQ